MGRSSPFLTSELRAFPTPPKADCSGRLLRTSDPRRRGLPIHLHRLSQCDAGGLAREAGDEAGVARARAGAAAASPEVPHEEVTLCHTAFLLRKSWVDSSLSDAGAFKHFALCKACAGQNAMWETRCSRFRECVLCHVPCLSSLRSAWLPGLPALPLDDLGRLPLGIQCCCLVLSRE